MINTKLVVLTKKLEKLYMKVVITCNREMRGGGHASFECQIGNHYSQKPFQTSR